MFEARFVSCENSENFTEPLPLHRKGRLFFRARAEAFLPRRLPEDARRDKAGLFVLIGHGILSVTKPVETEAPGGRT